MKEYLGDSVYVRMDDRDVVLTTENGCPSDPSNIIVLEPVVQCAFMRWLKCEQKAREAMAALAVAATEEHSHDSDL